MRLYDDRIACCQCGSGVAPCYRKGDGEIAGAEDGDGAERAQHRADVRFWRCALGVRSVDARHYPGAFLGNIGEEAKLIAGASDFARQARTWKRGFQMRAFDQRVSGGIYAIGHGTQERSAIAAG